MFLKKAVVKILGKKNSLKIYDLYKRFGKKIIYSSKKYSVIREKGDCFIGYYDLCPINDNRMLFHEHLKGQKGIKICIYDFEKKQVEVLADSKAWNWQQGSRLRWINDNEIGFNDYDEQNQSYISVFLNILSKNKRFGEHAYYDIANDVGASLNFNELGYLRPGYGYTNLPFSAHNQNDLAIGFYNIFTDEKLDCIRYNDISSLLNRDDFYINHISFNPSGERIIFFAIHIEKDIHIASLMSYDLATKKMYLLENSLSVSHYCWINDETLLVTAYDKKRNCKYYLYDVFNGKIREFARDILNMDGHPSNYLNSAFLTDTYPDNNLYQHLIIFDETNKETVFSIFHSTSCYGEHRCDLHPRLDLEKKKVVIDAAPLGKRRIYIVNL